jgi:NAD(P)H-dependent FMN reductase
VAVIIGSTREGRAGAAVGRWFAECARRRAEVGVEVLDLAGFASPGRHPGRPTPEMSRLTTAVGRAEGFVLVTPEYNRSFPASLKQAVDYAYDEWHTKPVGFVSYGCGSSGVHAVAGLRPVFAELHTVTVRDGVGIDLLDPAGIGTRTPGTRGHRAARRSALVGGSRCARRAHDAPTAPEYGPRAGPAVRGSDENRLSPQSERTSMRTRKDHDE